jgi:hypothetical protein
MYFGLTKEEEATRELRDLINGEINEFVNRETDEVKIHELHISPNKESNGYCVNMILGDHFDEFTSERCHARSDDLFNGKFDPRVALHIVKIIKKLHNKDKCERCEDGRKFMVPSFKTIVTNYHIVSSGRRLKSERRS